jgi:hypothetical protein
VSCLQTSGLSAEVCRDGGGSARDSSILEASREAEQKGGAGGIQGAFIGGLGLVEKLGFAQIDRQLGEVACRGWSPARGR